MPLLLSLTYLDPTSIYIPQYIVEGEPRLGQ